jgi:predicted fused transcriptional regulator/phosphomethylpyrimidine kinase
LPGEEDLQNKLENIENEFKTIERKKEEIQKAIDKIELFKSLLYETGKYGLEPPVREAFEKREKKYGFKTI